MNQLTVSGDLPLVPEILSFGSYAVRATLPGKVAKMSPPLSRYSGAKALFGPQQNESGRQLRRPPQPKGMKVSGRIVIKICSVASVGLLAYAALGPANWQLRPVLGWKTEHFLGFLIVTFITCVAWPRPLIIGLASMATAGLLEALQGLTPDRVPDFPTAFCGAGGALVASVAAEVFIRARTNETG